MTVAQGEGTYPSPLPVDSLDMWGATAGLPEQVEAAVSAAKGIGDLPGHDTGGERGGAGHGG